jgi:hypothetical protein
MLDQVFTFDINFSSEDLGSNLLNTNALNAITLSLRATNGSVAISPHKQEIASSLHSSQ